MSESYRRLPRDDSDITDLSTSSTLAGASPRPAPTKHRETYQRLESSVSSDAFGSFGSTIPEEEEDEGAIVGSRRRDATGLHIGVPSAAGIPTPTISPRKHERRTSSGSIQRVPVGSKDRRASYPSNPAAAPESFSAMASPYSSFSTYGDASTLPMSSMYSLGNEPLHSPYGDSDTDRLNRQSIAGSVKSAYDGHFHPGQACPTGRSFYQGRSNWLAVSIMILAVFSTIFSGIFLVIAVKAPRYGRMISKGGSLSLSSAQSLTAVFAKAIELSFASVFVAFLGQVLSRRAFMRTSRGVTLAELNMRNWIMQPGTMLTHYETVRFAAVSFLGAISLTAAVLAMLYTTAATALVQPQLKWGPWESKVLQSVMKTGFGNSSYIGKICPTPVRQDPTDENTRRSTCLQIEHASQGYHNYQQYLSLWSALVDANNGTDDLRLRPQGFGLLYENTTVNASWIEIAPIEAASAKYGRIVNNVSLAMPHAGVFAAARYHENGIIQPEEIANGGKYKIQASVPSPVLNVLCANMNKSELDPLVYQSLIDPDEPFTSDNFSTWRNDPRLDWELFKNGNLKTPVNDLFEWGQPNQSIPAFFKFPIPYNTVLNNTFEYGRHAVYLLGRGATDDYVLCSLRASITPKCSTRYSADTSGGRLEAHCEDPADKMAYNHTVPNAPSGAVTLQKDWPWVASEALNSLSLGTGMSDANASNSRILGQLMLQKPQLNSALPSVAEALAVMLGCTLLMSAQDAPFNMNHLSEFPYEWPAYEHGIKQSFNATIQAQEYASGGVSNAQRGFNVVLFAVFATNVFVLIYFIFNQGLVTDFSEPPNLFTIAVNSPPSQHLAGSCGGGPLGHQYKVNWFVNNEGDHLYMASNDETKEQHDSSGLYWRKGKGNGGPRDPSEIELRLQSPASVTADRKNSVSRMYSKLAKRRSLL